MHDHFFLGARHDQAERNVYATIALTCAMMALEIAGGWAFGSLALVADGFHMSTHAGALGIAAFAYTLARRRAADPRFSFGTGKFGDLAGFASALILAIVALEIAAEAANRLFNPGPIAFGQAIPIAALGLVVNLASAWLLSRDGHHHDDDHDHAHIHHDHNLRAAVLHVVADAAVSVFVIAGLALAWGFGWLFMDPLAALVGALVIASWSYQLIRATGAVLLDMNPDSRLCARLREVVAGEGDAVADLHLWRVGPGHLAAIVCVVTRRDAAYWRARLAATADVSHWTVETIAPVEP